MTDPDDDLTIPADADLLAELRAEIQAEDTSSAEASTPSEPPVDESDLTTPAGTGARDERGLIITPDEPEPAAASLSWSLAADEPPGPATTGPSTVAISKRRTRVFLASTVMVIVVLVLIIAALIVWLTP